MRAFALSPSAWGMNMCVCSDNSCTLNLVNLLPLKVNLARLSPQSTEIRSEHRDY